jgi:Zn/Cd-binding protein ZinT
VLVSAFGAGDTAAKASGFARLVYRTVLKGFLADKAVAERALSESGLNWTTVYPALRSPDSRHHHTGLEVTVRR